MADGLPRCAAVDVIGRRESHPRKLAVRGSTGARHCTGRLSNQFDFDASSQGKASHGHSGARRVRSGEVLCVDAIHGFEVTHIDQVHVDFDDVSEITSGSGQDRGQIIENLTSLGGDIALDELSRRRINRSLARQEECPRFTEYCMGVRSDRFGRLRIGDCVSGHRQKRRPSSPPCFQILARFPKVQYPALCGGVIWS